MDAVPKSPGNGEVRRCASASVFPSAMATLRRSSGASALRMLRSSKQVPGIRGITRYGQPENVVRLVVQHRPRHRRVSARVQLFGEIFLLGELPAVFLPVLRVVHVLHPMRRAAQHELALGGGDEDVLPEQTAGRRGGLHESTDLQSFRDCMKLFVADCAEPFRIDSRFLHGHMLARGCSRRPKRAR